MILAIRTESDLAEIGLVGKEKKIFYRWNAGRELTQDIHLKIQETLDKQTITYMEIKGIIFYEGPGSFTGLRIGATVANTLADQLKLPIAQSTGADWIDKGHKLIANDPKSFVVPNYGREPHITKPRK